mmetsp:Transcript_174331/g.558845  ORF Transcript_174331/g.558845 Transcript_174331/m.558845 type:complete len:171 (-) Transcript_174331:73-585(-)
MMCCFCSTNLCLGLCQVSFVFTAFQSVWSTDIDAEGTCHSSCEVLGCNHADAYCSCRPKCMDLFSTVRCCWDFPAVCPQEGVEAVVEDCRAMEVTVWTMTAVVAVVILLTFGPGVALSSYAWWHGTQLWQRLRRGEQLALSAATALSMRPPAEAGRRGCRQRARLGRRGA